MHPMMIMALSGEVVRERQRDRHAAQRRSLALMNRAECDGLNAARGVAWRPLAGFPLRPRLS